MAIASQTNIGRFITVVRDGAVATVTLDRGGGLLHRRRRCARSDVRFPDSRRWSALPSARNPLGMSMSWHAIPRLVSLMGHSRAKRVVVFGEKLDGKAAQRAGLIDEMAPDGQALARARRETVANRRRNAVRMTGQSVDVAANARHAATAFMDRDQIALAVTSEDYLGTIKAFLGKRAPQFTGR